MKFVWSAAAQKSFELLKEILILIPSFDVYCNASSLGFGAMSGEDGRFNLGAEGWF